MLVVIKLFKYFYKEKPLKPKYFTFWPVKDLLNFLSELHPPSELSLKMLTLKTLALIALTSSDRGQTIHLMDVENTALSDGNVQFVIFDRLKHTRRVLKPKVVNCITSDIDSLNVSNYVVSYMNCTLSLRAKAVKEGKEKPTKLFLSWATKMPVTKQTLARWLKYTLKLAGIDDSQYSSHSYRGAGLSNALSQYCANCKSWFLVKHGNFPETLLCSRK